MALSRMPAEIILRLLTSVAMSDSPNTQLSQSTLHSFVFTSRTIFNTYFRNKKSVLAAFLCRPGGASHSFLQLFDTLTQCPQLADRLHDLLTFISGNPNGVRTDLRLWSVAKILDCIKTFVKAEQLANLLERRVSPGVRNRMDLLSERRVTVYPMQSYDPLEPTPPPYTIIRPGAPSPVPNDPLPKLANRASPWRSLGLLEIALGRRSVDRASVLEATGADRALLHGWAERVGLAWRVDMGRAGVIWTEEVEGIIEQAEAAAGDQLLGEIAALFGSLESLHSYEGDIEVEGMGEEEGDD